MSRNHIWRSGGLIFSVAFFLVVSSQLASAATYNQDGSPTIVDGSVSAGTIDNTNIDDGTAYSVVEANTLDRRSNATVSYNEGGTSGRYRNYTGINSTTAVSWGVEQTFDDWGATQLWHRMEFDPIRGTGVVVIQDSAASPAIKMQSLFSTDSPVTLAADTDATTTTRKFDVAYETLSGRAIVAYQSDTDPRNLSYAIWNGTDAVVNLNASSTGGGTIKWVQLQSHPWKDDIMMVTLDSASDIYAQIWNGTHWSKSTLIENSGSSATNKIFDFQWESGAGQGVIVYGEGTTQTPRWANYTASGWSVEGTMTTVAGTIGWIEGRSDPVSDRIMFCVYESTGTDLNCFPWTGTAWTTLREVSTGLELPAAFTTNWESSDSEALVTFGVLNTDPPSSWVWTAAGGWAAAARALPDRGGDPQQFKSTSSPHYDEIILAYSDDTSDLVFNRWDGANWDPVAQISNYDLTASLVGITTEPFGITYSAASSRIGIEHASEAISEDPASVNQLNITYKFRSSIPDIFQLQVYNHSSTYWESDGCTALKNMTSFTANTYFYYTCNRTSSRENIQDYISNGQAKVRLISITNSSPTVGTVDIDFIQFNVVGAADAISPQYNTNTTSITNGTQYAPGRNYGFQINWTDSGGIDDVLFETNLNSSLRNFTVSRQAGSATNGRYVINFTDISAGSYNYKWYANDTSSNLNFTQTISYDISKNSSAVVVLALNGSGSDVSYTIRDTANFTANFTGLYDSINLTSNYTGFVNQGAAGQVIYNTTVLDFPGRNFNITAFNNGTLNYTRQAVTRFFNVTENILHQGNETIVFIESISRSFIFERASSEPTTIIESVSKSLSLDRLNIESLNVADLAVRSLNMERMNSESLIVAALTDMSFNAERRNSESLAVAESVSQSIALQQSNSEILVVADAASASLSFDKQNIQPIAVRDSIDTLFNAERRNSESLVIAESASRSLVFERVNSESPSVTDTASKSLSIERTNSEQLTVTDFVSVSVSEFSASAVCNNNTGLCFNTIQAAINNASAYQTIVIADGGYYNESVVVNVTGLTLTTNSTPTIFTQNSTPTITISSNNVTVSGLYIIYNGSFGTQGITAASRTNITISNSTINNSGSSNGNGIFLSGTSRSNVLNSVVLTSIGSNNNGIQLSSSNYNNFTGVSVNASGGGSDFGVRIDSSSGNIFTSSNLRSLDTATNGYGVRLSASNNNSFIDSTISGNNAHDIREDGSTATQNFIINCSFQKNEIGFASDSLGKIFVQYYLDARVLNSGGSPMFPANLTVNDTDSVNNLYNPTSNVSTQTNSSGHVPRQILTEFLANLTYNSSTGGTGYLYFTNYTVNASAIGNSTNSTAVNLTSSTSLDLTLYSLFFFQQNEAVTLFDLQSRNSALNFISTQSVSLSDFLSRSYGFERVSVDLLSALDTFSKVFEATRSSIQALFLSDLSAYTVSLQRSLSESLSVLDLSSYTKSLQRSVSESLAVYDLSRLVNDIRISVSETLDLTDFAAFTKSVQLSVSQSLSLLDLSAITKNLQASVYQQLSLLDASFFNRLFDVRVFQTVSLSDAMSVVQNAVRTLFESIDLSDLSAYSLNIQRSLSESLDLIDFASSMYSFQRSLSESLSVSDVSRLINDVRISVSETLGISDFVSFTKSVQKSLSESLSIFNLSSYTASLQRSFSESLDLSDFASFTRSLQRSVSESLAVYDLSRLINEIQRSVSESLNLSDLSAYTLSLQRSLSESLSLLDLSAITKNLQLSVSQTFSLLDVSRLINDIQRSVSETLDLTDFASFTRSLQRSVSETISASDFASFVKSLQRSVSESLRLDEVRSISLNISRLFSESLSFLDQSIVFRNFSVSVSEVLSFRDAVSLSDIIQAIIETITNIVSGGGGGGGASEAGAAPISLPELPIGEGSIRITKAPIVLSAQPGATTSATVVVQNNDPERTSSVDITVDGVPESWVSVAPTEMSLDPGASDSYFVIFDVPADAVLDDYRVEVTVSDGKGADRASFFLRVGRMSDFGRTQGSIGQEVGLKSESRDRPAFSRTVDVDRDKNQTDITINLFSARKDYKQIQLVETIDKSIAGTTDEITFDPSMKPVILERDPKVLYTFNDVKAGEEISVSYTVNSIVDDIERLVYWTFDRVTFINDDPPRGFQSTEVSEATFVQGAPNWFALKVKNLDGDRHVLVTSLDLPSGWNYTPENVTFQFGPMEEKSSGFQVLIPPNAAPGKYVISVVYRWDGTAVVKEVVVTIEPLSTILTVSIAVAAVLGAVLGLILLIRRRVSRSTEAKMRRKLDVMRDSLESGRS